MATSAVAWLGWPLVPALQECARLITCPPVGVPHEVERLAAMACREVILQCRMDNAQAETNFEVAQALRPVIVGSLSVASAVAAVGLLAWRVQAARVTAHRQSARQNAWLGDRVPYLAPERRQQYWLGERRQAAEALKRDIEALQAAKGAATRETPAPAPAREGASEPSPPAPAPAHPSAIRRLHRELRDMQAGAATYRAQGVTAAPVDDDLFTWRAQLFPSEGPLRAATLGAVAPMPDHLALRLEFPQDFPTHPPVVLLEAPRLAHPFVFGGALCADILTPQDWKPTYRIGMLLVQLLAFLQIPEHRARVTRAEPYDLAAARQTFQRAIVDLDRWTWRG